MPSRGISPPLPKRRVKEQFPVAIPMKMEKKKKKKKINK